MLILVVDDDPMTGKMLRFLFSEEGYEVHVEPHVMAARAYLARRQPDLMIMDVMMPRVDGISLCRSIRDNPLTQAIKVLAITAFPEQDNVKKMYDAGADLCLIKPLQFEHFRLEVIRLLNDPHLAESMGRLARARVLTEFSHQRLTRDMMGRYDSLLRDRVPVARESRQSPPFAALLNQRTDSPHPH